MFRGFRFQVVLPVATVALLLVSLGAIGFSLWTTQHEERRMPDLRPAAQRFVALATAFAV